MEGKFIVPLLGKDIDLCLFDSRAHGKSKSKLVTYGLLESEELGIFKSIQLKSFQLLSPKDIKR